MESKDTRAPVKISQVTVGRIESMKAYPTETRESIIVRALEALERERRAAGEGARKAS